ncbi:MAG: hypothetical protein ACNA8J_08615 [Gammaproteobacteria bacterium]
MSYFSLNKIPAAPGVYALFEQDRALMVGSAPNLRTLAEEHLFGSRGLSEELREVVPHPERISKISWWLHPALEDDGRRNAARWVAIEVLAPLHRPRFNLSDLGEMALKDPEFVKSMKTLLQGQPDGAYVPQSLHELTRSVYELKDKVAELERLLARKD